MKRAVKFLTKILLTCIFIVAIHFTYNFHTIKIDGIQAEIYSLVGNVGTKYSQDFSDKNFLKIESGMTVKQVIDLIGLPIRRFAPTDLKSFYNGSQIGLKYSDPTDDQSYRMRIVYISNGIVSKKLGEMYYD